MSTEVKAILGLNVHVVSRDHVRIELDIDTVHLTTLLGLIAHGASDDDFEAVLGPGANPSDVELFKETRAYVVDAFAGLSQFITG